MNDILPAEGTIGDRSLGSVAARPVAADVVELEAELGHQEPTCPDHAAASRAAR
jgi:hypothetical protein